MLYFRFTLQKGQQHQWWLALLLCVDDHIQRLKGEVRHSA
jgi:hypothetical protein